MSAKMDNRLLWGYNFSLEQDAHIAPTEMSREVLVIGGGVTGLVTAWILLDRGYKVTIVSKQWASYGKLERLTSQIAGALWEYPPAICGSHTNKECLIRSKSWCMVTYRIFEAIAADAACSAVSGIRMCNSAFFFPYKLVDSPKQLDKFIETYYAGVQGVRHNPKLIRELGIDLSYGIADAYELIVPVIDTDRAMMWFEDVVRGKGANLVTDTIRGDLLAQEESLLHRYNAHAIINATGLSSRELAQDPSCYPLRGALLRFINDGCDFPKITTAMSISADAAVDNEIVFLVPRNENILIVGGIAQPDEPALDLTINSPVVQRMEARCKSFLPMLKNARLDPEYPLAQGLRPAREQNIRIEREKRGNGRSRIIHSYGHGGSGWTLSFGCAEEVATLVDNIMEDRFVSKTDDLPFDGGMVRARL